MTAKTVCADCRFAEWGSDTLGLGMGTCACVQRSLRQRGRNHDHWLNLMQHARKEGADGERKSVCQYMRRRMNDAIMSLEPVPNIDDLADEIEDGRHLK
jgi:hypothetical protein